MKCDAKIRPFPNDTEVACELDEPGHVAHEGALRDYAYEGSVTVMKWLEVDRRCYHGEWPGACDSGGGCPLPRGHAGRHAD